MGIQIKYLKIPMYEFDGNNFNSPNLWYAFKNKINNCLNNAIKEGIIYSYENSINPEDYLLYTDISSVLNLVGWKNNPRYKSFKLLLIFK